MRYSSADDPFPYLWRERRPKVGLRDLKDGLSAFGGQFIQAASCNKPFKHKSEDVRMVHPRLHGRQEIVRQGADPVSQLVFLVFGYAKPERGLTDLEEVLPLRRR